MIVKKSQLGEIFLSTIPSPNTTSHFTPTPTRAVEEDEEGEVEDVVVE